MNGSTAPRVLFIGGRELGARCLALLLSAGASVCGVLARPDDIGTERSVAAIARAHGVPVIAPPRVREPWVERWIRDVAPTVGCCVMYPQVIPEAVLEIPAWGIVNLHGAPLPHYRGCLGHVWAIMNGEASYGVTMHQMVASLDAGPVCAQDSFPIDADETGTSLHAKAVEAAYVLFERVLPRMLEGTLPQTPQDPARARYYTKAVPFDRVVDWSWSADQIARFLRAMAFPGLPMPGTRANGLQIELVRGRPTDELADHPAAPGTVLRIDGRGALVRAGGGSLLVEAVSVPCGSDQAAVHEGAGVGAVLIVGARLGAR